jgi:phosphoribosylformylglycinamidine synthase subunit PurL
VPRTEESRFRSMCEARGLPAVRIGVVDPDSDAVEFQGLFTVPLAELRATSEAVLPRYFG